MSDLVRYDMVSAVATITLDRPEAMNALTVALKEQLIAALGRAAADPAVRAVVLTGAGRAFCVGQDLREHAATLAAGEHGVEDTVRAHYNPIALGIARMPKPVVAAVNGMAAGAGASFAFAADFRVAAEDAAFLMAFANVGLGADSGGSWTLPRLVGHAKATELLMLAEPVSAPEALRLGLVSRVVPSGDVLAEATALARRLAAGPTRAYAAIKSELDFSAAHPLEESLAHEADMQAAAGATRDHHNATEAFVAKRRPGFEGN